MYTDPLSDFLTRIRNAQAVGIETIECPSSNLKKAVANILKAEGYVEDVSERTEGGKRTLSVTLKYQGREPRIHEIHRLSKPGNRLYRKSTELPRVLSDLGIAILSTSAGIMTNKEARRRKLGGELLCEVS